MSNEELIRVLVSGAAGKMGQEVIKMLYTSNDMELVAAVDKKPINNLQDGVYVGNSLIDAIIKTKPRVMVDFTHPDSVLDNTLTAIRERVFVVVGTTGLMPEDLDKIHTAAEETSTGVLIAPNFALGAVLMMELSKQLARYFSEVEIIEMHNQLKADSPSGTALRTAEGICNNLQKAPIIYDCSPARGQIINNIPIHSIRLPGLIAHQEVIFGAQGQTLSIRHDSYDRTSFMPGVALAIKTVLKQKGLIYGLENILDL
ncbi:MAG: 4-hydroxy-tetrahydrodipicolinate reductase [Bacillota bacterium]